MQSHNPDLPVVVAYVALDWADEQHEGRLQAEGSSRVESFVIPQRPEAVQDWVSQLRARFPFGSIAVILEQSRGALIYALMSSDFFLLYPVPPKTLADYRKAFCPSGAKSDPRDADLLLDLLLRHRDRLRLWRPDDALTRQLTLLNEHRRTLVEDRTRLTNRLTSLLKQYFPQALEWAGPLDHPRACKFLSRWQSLQDVQKARGSELRRFYRNQGWNWKDLASLEQRVEEIRRAQPLTRDEAVVQAHAPMVSALAEQLRPLFPALEKLEKTIAELFAQHQDSFIWKSLPGAGAALQPRLLAAFGSDRQHYHSAREMQQFCGIAPVTQRSGKSCWVHWRWACPKFVRQTFHEFAAHSRQRSPWARAYYERQRARGASHHAAVRALAYKWIRILYRCWQTRTPYIEQRYLLALERGGSHLVAQLKSQPARHIHEA
jgi:transposase